MMNCSSSNSGTMYQAPPSHDPACGVISARLNKCTSKEVFTRQFKGMPRRMQSEGNSKGLGIQVFFQRSQLF